MILRNKVSTLLHCKLQLIFGEILYKTGSFFNNQLFQVSKLPSKYIVAVAESDSPELPVETFLWNIPTCIK